MDLQHSGMCSANEETVKYHTSDLARKNTKRVAVTSLRARREREETARLRWSVYDVSAFNVPLFFSFSPFLFDGYYSLVLTKSSFPFLSLVRRASVSPFVTTENGRTRKPFLAGGLLTRFVLFSAQRRDFATERNLLIIEPVVDLDLE